MNNTAGRLINYVKDFNKESLPSDDELGPTFPFNIIQTPRSNGKSFLKNNMLLVVKYQM